MFFLILNELMLLNCFLILYLLWKLVGLLIIKLCIIFVFGVLFKKLLIGKLSKLIVDVGSIVGILLVFVKLLFIYVLIFFVCCV